ncbi:MAG: 5'-methylthioadenosine/adenosylhomocysteine nucleosidase [Patescibacteria group bacterium]
MIGIIGAMEEEIVLIKKEIKNLETIVVSNMEFYCGDIFGKKIVLVKCGIGKVNVAICATLLIERFNVSEIIFTGVAGGINENLNVGDIVVSSDLIQHDFDTTCFGEKLGQIPRMDQWIFKASDYLINIVSSVCKNENLKYIKGRILSGDQFINSKEKVEYLKQNFEGDAVEMEGAALAHVCCVFNIPFVVIRSISDKADNSSHIDFNEFCLLAANNSKKIVCGLLKLIC